MPNSAITRLVMLIFQDGLENPESDPAGEILGNQDPWEWNSHVEWED